MADGGVPVGLRCTLHERTPSACVLFFGPPFVLPDTATAPPEIAAFAPGVPARLG